MYRVKQLGGAMLASIDSPPVSMGGGQWPGSYNTYSIPEFYIDDTTPNEFTSCQTYSTGGGAAITASQQAGFGIWVNGAAPAASVRNYMVEYALAGFVKCDGDFVANLVMGRADDTSQWPTTTDHSCIPMDVNRFVGDDHHCVLSARGKIGRASCRERV